MAGFAASDRSRMNWVGVIGKGGKMQSVRGDERMPRLRICRVYTARAREGDVRVRIMWMWIVDVDVHSLQPPGHRLSAVCCLPRAKSFTQQQSMSTPKDKW
jgi:hypothetical protein